MPVSNARMPAAPSHARQDPGPAARIVLRIGVVLLVAAAALGSLFNPAWIGVAQSRAGVAGITGWSASEVDRITGDILRDVLVGPPRFEVSSAEGPVLGPEERGHMGDVFRVLRVFELLVLLFGGVALVVAWRHRRRAATWRAVAGAARGLAIAGLALVVAVAVLFDQLWLTFHLVFFPQGNFLFDPSTNRLTQLFPDRFWVESATAVVAIGAVLALAAWWLSRRRARHLEMLDAAAPGSRERP